MLKVGDKVQIKIREKDIDDYRCGFIPEMSVFSGCIFTITRVFLGARVTRPTIIPDDGYCYKLSGEAAPFVWTSGMFTLVGESSQSEETKPKFIDFTRHHRRRYKWNYKC